MDIFVRNLPDQMTDRQVDNYFRPYFQRLGIKTWKCNKLKSRGCAAVTILDVPKAQQFLALHGQTQPGAQGFKYVRQPLYHMNRSVICSASNKKPDKFLIKSLEKEEKDKHVHALQPGRKRVQTHAEKISRLYDITQLWCGQWDYLGSELGFANYYQTDRPGQITFGPRGLFITLRWNRLDHRSEAEHQMEIPYRIFQSFTTGTESDPSLTFSLTEPPKVFEKIDQNKAPVTGDPLADMISALLLKERKFSPIRRKRVKCLDSAYETVFSACLCYRFQLRNSKDIRAVQNLKRFPEIPGSISLTTSFIIRPPFAIQMTVLNDELASYQNVPFELKFQMQRLAQNGSLAPYLVSELLVAIDKEITPGNSKAFVDAVYQLHTQLPYAGPDAEASDFRLQHLLRLVTQNRDRIDKGYSFAEAWEHYEHITPVHKAVVTPTGIYLDGPYPEVKNRVLRKYTAFPNHFLSVSFSDEDGDFIRYDRQTSNEDIFRQRFKKVLEAPINVAGRLYEFLGFSHSSLRSHTCWFMAPFVTKGSLTHARSVIKDLGDFTKIRSPAKCAARIGQAFSQTLSSIALPPEAIEEMPDIERNDRTFSDGVGTCSAEVLHKVWDNYTTAPGMKPTILQVRIQGAKGVLSLDTRLQGLVVRLRPSMVKFEGTNVSDIEICGSALKPLPMFLNRQLIKILEDLGVNDDAFLSLQAVAIDKLRMTTSSAKNAAAFLKRHSVGVAARLPWLIRRLSGMGLSFIGDDFLKNTLELAVLAQLRELKHRARILVEQGVTLYGIMDETGILEEGQIYCSVPSEIIMGMMVITRCPALHPGDVRCVEGVDAPAGSPLRDLQNVVVFSQKGSRDLPSMLSGGDLDGDLYNVIWDPDLFPNKVYSPADYHTPHPIDIGRAVERSDMTDHFLSFMQNDALGRIAVLHQIIADQSDEGVLDSVCLQLAELHSDAVDFSKTGIAVPVDSIPRYPNTRPDFLANGPRVLIEKNIKLDENDMPSTFAEEEELDEAASYAAPKMQYYESPKILGKLYRDIDEHKFLAQVQTRAQSSSIPNQDVVGTLWNYVREKCALIQWEHQIDAARDIKESYEDNLVDTMMAYSTDTFHFVSEVEVFSGSILGKLGDQSKKQREYSREMKTRFDRDVTYTVQCIRHGDSVDDQDALARSLACLYVSFETKNARKKVGALVSFQWIAAAVCLKEVEDVFGTEVPN